MKSLPYFRWYPADAEGDDFYAGLTDSEGWIYTRLLNRSWMNDGIPSELGEMSRAIGRTPAQVSRVWPKLRQRWEQSPRDPAKLVNPRQELERSIATKTSENNKRVGNANASKSRSIRDQNAPPRARMDVDVVSVSSSEEQERKDFVALSQSEYPLVLSQIRRRDPAVDEMFVLRLVQQTTQHLLSSSVFPQHRIEAATTDKVIAKACEESFATGPPAHRAGLLLKRVPQIILAWGTEKGEVNGR